VLQVCEQQGIEIPRFCYHEKLKIAGNCRMCLVEVKPGPPKPQASCAMPANNGMEVQTESAMVKRAREGVMEFLLINHPLDCPICDQGGECDLQDQSVAYGKGISRYDECKRSVEDKNMGPLIKTTMTRCIHCTRCVRFAEEIAGVPELGAVGRGEHMEITTYVEQAFHSELSANIIDLCPVGALTSRPYAFAARPWELTNTDSVDVMDAVGSSIRVDSRGNAVLRILPRANDEINEEWISDKTRYACDGLKLQRLDKSYIRENGKLRAATWEEAFAKIAEKTKGVPGEKIAALAGDQACVESMTALKDLMTALGSGNIDCRQDGAKLNQKDRASYLFNTSIAGLEDADLILLVGTNPRWEAPLVNARIRKTYLRGNLKVYNLGNPHDLTYKVEELGTDPQILSEIANGKHPLHAAIQQAKKPVIILGMGALTRPDGESILQTAKFLASKTPIIQANWNGFNILHTAAARVGGLDIGFVPSCEHHLDTAAILNDTLSGVIDVIYLLGVDEIDAKYYGKSFVIYQGSHGDVGAERADVILPGSAYTEKDATYVNMEGRPQRTGKAVAAPGEAKEDWKIIRALAEKLNIELPYNNLAQLREYIAKIAPQLANIDELTPASWLPVNSLEDFPIAQAGFEEKITNFYMTDPISRISPTMAECTRDVLKINPEKNKAA